MPMEQHPPEWILKAADKVISDPGVGLAAAINAGIKALPDEITYVNWLGDDDIVLDGGLVSLSGALERDSKAVLAFGHCRYIDAGGDTLFDVHAGRWATNILRFGPQLVSQPAMLFRRSAFSEVGGLDELLRWAFDLDLLLRLARCGMFVPVHTVVACYRWHDEALTVGQREGSVREASSVRKRYLPKVLQMVSEVWEAPLRAAILRAGHIVRRRAHRTESQRQIHRNN
jgi:GT2 family glycosyltransferase